MGGSVATGSPPPRNEKTAPRTEVPGAAGLVYEDPEVFLGVTVLAESPAGRQSEDEVDHGGVLQVPGAAAPGC